jgi:DNA-binding HxlR family transcriptional regulator
MSDQNSIFMMVSLPDTYYLFVATLCIRIASATKGTFMCVDREEATGVSTGRQARTNVRANVRRAPGPCSHWDGLDADFIREILDLVGDKWSVLIIGTLADGPVRYSDLAHAIPGISQRMLTLTLKQLQRSGLVIRTAHAEVPPRVEYSLADLGTSLLSTVLELAAWSADRHAEIRRHQNAYDARTEPVTPPA